MRGITVILTMYRVLRLMRGVNPTLELVFPVTQKTVFDIAAFSFRL
jgi:hypothetical protein